MARKHEGYYHDNEWLHEPNVITSNTMFRTRAQEQQHIDDLYGKGLITQAEWSIRTDELSDLRKWRADGKVTQPISKPGGSS